MSHHTHGYWNTEHELEHIEHLALKRPQDGPHCASRRLRRYIDSTYLRSRPVGLDLTRCRAQALRLLMRQRA